MKSNYNPVLLSALLAVFVQSCHSQTNNLEPGKDRWAIKTSILANAKTKQISLQDLEHLPAPVASYSKKLYDKDRIPDSVLYNGKYYKEGDIVTTTGYIHLVALEKDDNNRDGDYHIQVLPGSKWADSCLVIEVPYPEFIFNDEALKARIAKARQFVINELLNNHHPNTKATALRPAIHVAITGQLFFDGSHLKGNPRGKQDPDYKIPMKSYTCWEIHPVSELKLLK